MLIIVWLLINRGIKNSRAKTPGDKTPLEILKERYARGEINKEEYEEKKKELLL